MPLPALRILLVEDIELNVIVARSVLGTGNSVDVAMTGKAALEMFYRASMTWCCSIFSYRT